MADLASGDVLLMHLGMSGSFRVIKPDNEAAPGEFHYPKGKDSTHDHVLFRCPPAPTSSSTIRAASVT